MKIKLFDPRQRIKEGWMLGISADDFAGLVYKSLEHAVSIAWQEMGLSTGDDFWVGRKTADGNVVEVRHYWVDPKTLQVAQKR